MKHEPQHSSPAAIAIVTGVAIALVAAITVTVGIWQTVIRYP